ncbi:MAG: amidohydrolase [Bacillota bacterium]|nr:amidohydrolase [Bacillota bacterium]
MNIKNIAKKYESYAIEMRRHFHMNPEPSMEEYETQKKVMEELDKMGIENFKAAGTGVVGIINGEKEGKTVALRADMDALELQEENDIPYKSKNEGYMHGCGHDGHTAGLLTAGKILNEMKSEIEGTVKLVFQPGEENGKGALALIDEGILDDVDAIFGIHLWNELESGKVSVESGPRMASAGIFYIHVKGQGGHGSMPNQGVDAGLVGAAILMNLQTVVSREISPLDPAVLSIGIFKSGTRFNVIPSKAYLEGTTRCFSMEVNYKFEGQIKRIVENTAKAYKAEAELDYRQLVLPTINDEELSVYANKVAVDLVGEEGNVLFEKTTGGEDFSFFSQKAKTEFAFVGTRNDKKVKYYPHHHSHFDIDETALTTAAGLYAGFAIEYLKGESL